jgi:hypothetical protein
MSPYPAARQSREFLAAARHFFEFTDNHLAFFVIVTPCVLSIYSIITPTTAYI